MPQRTILNGVEHASLCNRPNILFFVNLRWSRALRCLYTFKHALFRYSNCRRRILGRRLGFRVDPGLRIFFNTF
jgi:hypothetical protein